MVKRKWIRASGLGAASVRFLVVTVAAGLSLAPGRRGFAADAAVHAARSEAPDGGVSRAVPQQNVPAGAFLGPLKKAGESDPERRYPLTPRANGSLFYEAPQFSAEVAP